MVFINVLIYLDFFFKQKTAYEILSGLVGSEMCIRDSAWIEEMIYKQWYVDVCVDVYKKEANL